MINRTFVKSFYTNVLVTCYEVSGIKYVANQHGNWDVYEGPYERGERSRSINKESEEIKKIITEYKVQDMGKK
jgi:hypothetical protein